MINHKHTLPVILSLTGRKYTADLQADKDSQIR